MDKLDFAVLNLLLENDAVTKIAALSRKEILDSLEINESTLFRKIKNMKELGYIQEGFKAGKAYTYFVTKDGIQIFEEAIQ